MNLFPKNIYRLLYKLFSFTSIFCLIIIIILIIISFIEWLTYGKWWSFKLIYLTGYIDTEFGIVNKIINAFLDFNAIISLILIGIFFGFLSTKIEEKLII